MAVPALDGLPSEPGRLMRNAAVTAGHRPGPPGLPGPYEGIPLTSRTSPYAGSCPTGSPSAGRRSAPSAAPGRRPATRSAVPSSARSPAISAVTATGSANSAGKTRIRSARMPASAAGRVERNGQGARPWPCPRGHSAAGTSASRGRRLTGNPSRSATRVLARPRKDTAVVDRDLGFIAAGQEGLAGGGSRRPSTLVTGGRRRRKTGAAAVIMPVCGKDKSGSR